ncbi:MAG: MBL fold metallo-hydrolase [Candidatus Thorarchaeota archaeon]|nr:MAG: MBL fold metallo-hydrolase [Candidatus Thorarchaeota archaeon]
MNQKTKFVGLIVLAVVIGAGMTGGILLLQGSIGNNVSTTTPTTNTTTTTTTTAMTLPPIDIPDPLHYEGVDIWWIVVGGVKLKFNDIVVYIDPTEIYGLETPFLEPADYIIVTHEHGPHASPGSISAVRDSNTTVIVSMNSRYSISEDVVAYPNDTLEYEGVTFEFVPAYNIDKLRPSGEPFHPPENNMLGVIVNFNGIRIYHAGDTDRIPEMQSINTDVALLPVSGYAWMEPDEAAGAVDDLKLNSDLAYAVPIHWGHNQGSRWHAEQFEALANCTVVILDRLVT